MAEQTFRSPGFFEQEIDLSERQVGPSGTPAGIVGTAQQGPAFVPVVLGSFSDFQARFGGLDPNRFGPYAVREWLRNRNAVTYMRVLGAGANDSAAQIGTTEQQGTVTNAGFKVGATALGRGDEGAVQFLCAKHYLSSSGPAEMYGFPVFSDNRSFLERAGSGQADVVNLVRAVVMVPSGTRMMIADDADGPLTSTKLGLIGAPNALLDDYAKHSAPEIIDSVTQPDDGTFKLIIFSRTSGNNFAADDGIAGARIMSASLNPDHVSYVGKILNTDPTKFESEEHLLYLDYAVEHELAPVAGQLNGAICVASGSSKTGAVSTDTFTDLFGRYDTRYTTPRTPHIISQPFGDREYDLFKFETISDGAYANDKYKISVANIRASSNPDDLFGTFEIQVRRFGDTDIETEVLERYPACTLNPNSESYVGRLVGDKKVYFDFDADQDSERRLVIEGKYPNRSSRIRIIMNSLVEGGDVPQDSLPFGFRGIPVLKTSEALTDDGAVALTDPVSSANIGSIASGSAAYITTGFGSPNYAPKSGNRLAASSSIGSFNDTSYPNYQTSFTEALTGSIVPPLPYRFKVTRGQVEAALPTKGVVPSVLGQKGLREKVDSRFYWGVKPTRLPKSSSVDFSVLNTNVSNVQNPLVTAYTRFQGIQKLDMLITGSAVDLFNDNKFTMARVALYNTLNSNHITDVSGTAKEHMLEACYIRNGIPDPKRQTITDPIATTRDRITMATLLQSSSVHFNRFTDYNKFTTIFYGGFDGLNILNKDNYWMTDKASSVDANGLAAAEYTDTGLAAGNVAGTKELNNCVFAYRTAARIMTDEMTVNTNLLSIPGIRDSLITDVAADGAKANSLIMYVMDIPFYDEGTSRLYKDSDNKPDVRETAEAFDSRAVDNNYAATYFPDVVIEDQMNNRRVAVPSSIAALTAIGFNDRVGYPWFAPAGFNRGALDIVSNTSTRLTAGDRDTLYDARINPIATFPNGGGRATFVIFGQKTLQLARSALDRVNVRRMLLEVKRQVTQVANRILFEPNNAATRAKFVGQITPLLALVQSQAGIESFSIVCDDSNNTSEDVEANKMNGRIILVPTRAVEFISIDFIITNSGVSFE